MIHETDLNSDLFAGKLLDGIDSGLGDNHVVAAGEIVDENADGGFTARPGDQGIAVGHTNGVGLPGRISVHGGRVIIPHELDIDACFLEPVLLDCDFPCHPSGPIAVGNLERFGVTAMRRPEARTVTKMKHREAK
jgi:hypothetical protein